MSGKSLSGDVRVKVMRRTRTTVILAAGEFPRKGGEARRLLESAGRVVACDSAALAFRRHCGRWPEVVVGDLDSLGVRHPPCEVVCVSEQDTNDLAKAAEYCARRRWRVAAVVGATGKREDHTLGNVFRALAHGLTIVTDRGRFVPVVGRRTLSVARGAAVSVFAPDPATRMTSRGLEWPLDRVRFRNLFCATLNRATVSRVTLAATRPVTVFVAQEPRSDAWASARFPMQRSHLV